MLLSEIKNKVAWVETQGSYTPKLARVAQREKKFNEFWLQNLLWGYLCNSKLQKTKKLTKPFWRAGGTQAEKSSKFGQNRLCVLAAISKMASLIFLFFAILNHINIPITNFEVRICWTFFSSELPLPTWVTYIHSGDDYLVTYFFYHLLANQGKYFYFIRISWAAVLLLAMLVKCLMLCLYVLSFTTVWLKTWLLWSPLLKILKKYICFLSDLFWLDLPKSLAKIIQRPENRKDWSKLLMWYCR